MCGTDDISCDEPFIVAVNGKPFGVVPYAIHTNDMLNYELRYQSTLDFAQDLKNEFDQLYYEGGHRRRMMALSAHDRVSGRPGRAKVIEDFITYAQKHEGVWFARKDEIIRYALEIPLTPRES
jgi:peptidoglycan/xylan/chitin deacetylase (PgdA/CDA1 family)